MILETAWPGHDMTDTAPTIEARYSAPRLWLLVAVMGIPAIGSGFLGFSPYVHWTRTSPLLWLGACTAFCGALAILFVYMAIMKSGKVAFTVGPDGTFDTRISKEVIPWCSIEAISTWRDPTLPGKSIKYEPIVLLQLKAGESDRLPITQFARLARATDKRLNGPDGFHLRTGGTDVDYRRLLEVGESYLASAKSAMQHNG